MQLYKGRIIGGCIMACKIWCEIVETLLMLILLQVCLQCDVVYQHREDESQKILFFCSLTTELYTEHLWFSSNIPHCLVKLNLTPHLIEWFLVISYLIHVPCTYFFEKKCGSNVNENKKFHLFTGVLWFNKNIQKCKAPLKPCSSSGSVMYSVMYLF